jgi:hypothetical protein
MPNPSFERDAAKVIRPFLTLPVMALLAGCCGGHGCDHLLSPNWENRQAKFAAWMKDEVGKPFPTHLMCDDKHENVEPLPGGSTRYSYSYREGCTYYCEVRDGKVAGTSYTGGEAERSCYLTLN